MRLTPCCFQQIDEALLQAEAGVALDQIEAEPCELAARSAALDRDLRDRGRMQPARELMFDHGSRSDGNFVDDELSRHDAEDELLAVLEGERCPLARLDRRKADLAGRRVGVKLLDGASRAAGETRRPQRHRPGRITERGPVWPFRHGAQTGSAQTCSAGCQNCNRLRVRGQPRLIVLGCRS